MTQNKQPQNSNQKIHQQQQQVIKINDKKTSEQIFDSAFMFHKQAAKQIQTLSAAKKQLWKQYIHKSQQSQQTLKKSLNHLGSIIQQNRVLSLQLKNISKQNSETQEKYTISNQQITQQQEIIMQLKYKVSKLEEENKQNNQKAQIEIKQLNRNIQNLKKIIQQKQQEIKSVQKEYSKKIQDEHNKNDENVNRIVTEYQKVIEGRVRQISENYHRQLQAINNNNRNIILQLEQQQLQMKDQSKKKQVQKFKSLDGLVDENKKLLQALNHNKTKILNLETQIESLRQQNNINKKHHQLILETLKKQLSSYKEDKSKYEQKITKLSDKVQQLKWGLRECNMEHQKTVSKIKQQYTNEKQQYLDGLVSIKEQLQQCKREKEQIKSQVRAKQLKISQLIKNSKGLEEIIDYVKKEHTSNQGHDNKSDVYNEEIKRERNRNKELHKQVLKKSAEIQLLKDENMQLKAKIKKINGSLQEFIKQKQTIEDQNKMLLSEIVFLRDKNKNRNSQMRQSQNRQEKKNRSVIFNLDSEQSEDLGDLQIYKQVIAEMEKDMNEALNKINEKNQIIDRQKSIIQRLQRALNN